MSPPRQTCVALDLETTGLSPEQDQIIEIGAVKFQGDTVVETFHRMVNPFRPLSPFIVRLTGIAQAEVDSGEPFGKVAGPLERFVGACPVVGHNVGFDLAFLARGGLTFSGPSFDTWDLASILLPRAREYSLGLLAASLGVQHTRPHRALEDAQVTREVFLKLYARLEALEPGLLAALAGLSQRSTAWLRHLVGPLAQTSAAGGRTAYGPLGLDLASLSTRLAVEKSTLVPDGTVSLEAARVERLLGPDGPLGKAFPSYEHRPEQVQMACAVAKAFREGRHLVVEGGTGIGKSVAYLLPAMLFALRTGKRVVISTNTIALQEQLVNKDIPALLRTLEGASLVAPGKLRAATLKGRANYLCLRRWGQLARANTLNAGELRLMGKTLVWLQETCSGDRGEVNLGGRDDQVWPRLSADDRAFCPGTTEGVCFLRAARERAEAANILIVNHALLLTDLARGNGLIPKYDHLIVDEAHHLEEEATRQLGFQVSQRTLLEHLEAYSRTLDHARAAVRGARGPDSLRQQAEALLTEAEKHAPRVRQTWSALWQALTRFCQAHKQDGDDRAQLRLLARTFTFDDFSEVEVAWENVDLSLGELGKHAAALREALESGDLRSPTDDEATVLALSGVEDGVAEVREHLKLLLRPPADDRIHWVAQEEVDGALTLHDAPFSVAGDLKKRLFEQKETVTLTSATLAIQGTFAHVRDRLGLEDAEELLVGSPFDYQRAALLLLPTDVPEPDAPDYLEALKRTLGPLAKALGGHTLALFTSHSGVQNAARVLREALDGAGVAVLAQGVDGTPRQLVDSFSRNPKAVLLGTSSFWEGVDLSGGLLRALVISRLPFNVPSEPVFAARCEQYDDPFGQYALPQAVLRFRQGFGRLIRSKGDRGIVLLLDRRVQSRRYGQAFLKSLPPCCVTRVPMSQVAPQAKAWLGG